MLAKLVAKLKIPKSSSDRALARMTLLTAVLASVTNCCAVAHDPDPKARRRE